MVWFEEMVRGFLVVPPLPKVRQVEKTVPLIEPTGLVLMMGLVDVLGWDVFRFCLIPPAELWDRSKASKNQV